MKTRTRTKRLREGLRGCTLRNRCAHGHSPRQPPPTRKHRLASTSAQQESSQPKNEAAPPTRVSAASFQGNPRRPPEKTRKRTQILEARSSDSWVARQDRLGVHYAHLAPDLHHFAIIATVIFGPAQVAARMFRKPHRLHSASFAGGRAASQDANGRLADIETVLRQTRRGNRTHESTAESEAAGEKPHPEAAKTMFAKSLPARNRKSQPRQAGPPRTEHHTASLAVARRVSRSPSIQHRPGSGSYLRREARR